MKNLYIILFTGVVLFSSCDEDFLDQYPPQQITSGNFYQNEDQMILASNAVFDQVYTVWSPFSLPYLFGDLYGGDSYLYKAPGTAGDFQELGDAVADPGLAPPSSAWNEYYKSIFFINDFLTELDNFDESKFTTPDLASRMRAEALFVRSCFYYYLTEVFGDVPLVTTVLTPANAIVLTRDSKSTVVSQVISDLNFAVDNLPASYGPSEQGRPTMYAAKAMLARVYMANGENATAESELRDIIDSNQFSLDADDNGIVNTDDYLYVFDDDTRFSPSTIFELPFIPGAAGKQHNYAGAYCPFPGLFIPGIDFEGQSTGLGAPTEDLHNAFETADSIRQKITSVQTLTDGTIWPHTAKYYWGYDDGIPFIFGNNIPVIRYAEVLLNYAELTNDPQYLNMVRARAELPAYGDPDYPSGLYPTFAEALEHERRVEFAFEYHRGFDLKRTGRFLEVKSAEQGRQLASHQVNFPIPLTVLDVNVNMKQTTGY